MTTGTRAAVPDEVFRDVIGRFASGVTVITTTADDGDHGTTASAVSSLSMAPPMLLVCLNKTSDTGAASHASGVFGGNILAADQGQVAYRFAEKGPGEFEGVPVARGRTGVPPVQDALAHLECAVDETVTGGTHPVFLARVEEATGKEGAPLAYFRGRFGRLESALDEAAYRELRRRVIERTLPVGAPLDLERLATELVVDAQRVFYALEQLQGLADDLARIVHSEAPDLAAFVHTSHEFHRQLVALAACRQLSESYERLGIPAFWTRTMAQRRWWEEFDVVHHAELVKAYRTGEADRARQLIEQHRDQVTGLARALITEAGGEV